MDEWLKSGILPLQGASQEDALAYATAYDQALWTIATSSPQSLSGLLDDFESRDFSGTPIPLIVVAARIVLRESADQVYRDLARTIIQMYCDAEEEKTAVGNDTSTD